MQDQLKLLHQKSLQYEQQARTRTNSLQSQGTQPRSPSTPRRNTQPSSGQSGPRMHSRQASLGASSDVSGKEGFLTSPRISRRSSTDSLSMHSHGRGSQPTPNGQVRRPSISEGVWATSDGSPARPLRHPSGSVQSISSQAFWRPGATSDLGSSMHGSQEITVVAKMVDDGTQSPAITGVNCIKALVSIASSNLTPLEGRLRLHLRYEPRHVSGEIGVACLIGCSLRAKIQNREQQGGYLLSLSFELSRARNNQSETYKDPCIGDVITGNFWLESQTSLLTQTYSGCRLSSPKITAGNTPTFAGLSQTCLSSGERTEGLKGDFCLLRLINN